jgi:hypothetical protein
MKCLDLHLLVVLAIYMTGAIQEWQPPIENPKPKAPPSIHMNDMGPKHRVTFISAELLAHPRSLGAWAMQLKANSNVCWCTHRFHRRGWSLRPSPNQPPEVCGNQEK